MKKFNNIQNISIKVDNNVYFVSRSVACVNVILVQNDNGIFVLINKRGVGSEEFPMDMPHRWNLPAGYLDWNETGLECAKREVWQECDVDMDELLARPDVLYTHEPFKVLTSPVESVKQNVVLCYGFKIIMDGDQLPAVSNKNCEENEVEEISWCSIYDFHKYELCYNHDKRIIDYLRHIGL
jgi:8-oxo-dGTP pyrophosphatase MutT (NUDIX family)